MEQYKIYEVKHKRTKEIIYIGRTKQSLQRRISEHFCHKNSQINELLNNNKNDYEFIIIDYANNQHDANLKEIFWTLFFMEQYDLKNKGIGNISTYYISKENLHKHWENSLKKYYQTHDSYWKGKHLSEETKQKLSEANKGKIVSQEQKKQISQTLKERYKYETHHMTGKHLSEKTKQKISEANKGKTISQEQREKISQALTGIKRSKEFIEKMRQRVTGKNNGKSRQVQCIETGEIFDTITEANKKYHCKHISLVCKGVRKSAGKLNGQPLHWKYV